jgi:ribosomal protein L7Ae-like RNA K-turn-binding protein
MINKLVSMISLCQKSGNLLSGEANCENAIKSKKAKVIIVAADASDNTKKKFSNSAVYYKIPIYYFLTREELGTITGKKVRAVLTVMDDNFSAQIINLFEIVNNEK